MLIQFNKSADGIVSMTQAKKIASILITPKSAEVDFVSGQHDRFEGDYRDIEDLLVEHGFAKGVRDQHQKDHQFLNVNEAQKIEFQEQNGCYKLTATFPQDVYQHRNNTHTILTSRKYINALYARNVIVRGVEKMPSLAL